MDWSEVGRGIKGPGEGNVVTKGYIGNGFRSGTLCGRLVIDLDPRETRERGRAQEQSHTLPDFG